MITTNNDEIAEKARLIRHHGEPEWYHYVLLGYNYRMTELQAALGIEQLKRINELNERRREIAKIYNDELENLDTLTLPTQRPYVKHVWHIYNIILNLEKLRVSRDRIVEAIKAEHVGIGVAYPSVLYLEPLFQKKIGYGKGCPWTCKFYGKEVEYKRGLCPNAEWISERTITLNTSPYMDDEYALETAKAVKKVLNYYRI